MASGNALSVQRHHGFGVGGQHVAPQTNGTASPSLIKVSPTSRPFAFNVPHRLSLAADMPAVLASTAFRIAQQRQVSFVTSSPAAPCDNLHRS
jgi:hypothetical protein